jgi:hypothetical protein
MKCSEEDWKVEVQMGGYVKRIRGQWRYRIGVRWQWTEQHGREVLGRPKLI